MPKPIWGLIYRYDPLALEMPLMIKFISKKIKLFSIFAVKEWNKLENLINEDHRTFHGDLIQINKFML